MPRTTSNSKEISLISFNVLLDHSDGKVFYECVVYGVLAGDKEAQFCSSSWVKVRELVSVAEKEGWKVERTSTDGSNRLICKFIWELSRDTE